MTLSQPTSVGEPNAIFWLEFRQAKRNWLLLGLLVFGVLAQIPFWSTGLWGLLLLGIFTQCFNWFLLFYFGWKMASQRLNEDMVLFTPLTPYQILNGKILFGFLCSALYYAPTLLMAFFRAAVMGEADWLIYAIIGFFYLPCKIIVVTGFMAGAKSLNRTIILVFLLCVFGFAAFAAYTFFLTVLYFYYPASSPTIGLLGVYGTMLLFGLPSAVFAYFVGISGLSSDLKTRKTIARKLTTIFIPCFVVLLWFFLIGGFGVHRFVVTILLLFYFAPLIAAASLGGVFRVNSGLKPEATG